jgi:hypothetical protein
MLSEIRCGLILQTNIKTAYWVQMQNLPSYLEGSHAVKLFNQHRPWDYVKPAWIQVSVHHSLAPKSKKWYMHSLVSAVRQLSPWLMVPEFHETPTVCQLNHSWVGTLTAWSRNWGGPSPCGVFEFDVSQDSNVSWRPEKEELARARHNHELPSEKSVNALRRPKVPGKWSPRRSDFEAACANGKWNWTQSLECPTNDGTCYRNGCSHLPALEYRRKWFTKAWKFYDFR